MTSPFVAISYQNTVFDGSGRSPVEHPSAVILHLSFSKIKILCLVICDTNFHLPILLLVSWVIGWPAVACPEFHQSLARMPLLCTGLSIYLTQCLVVDKSKLQNEPLGVIL